VLCERSAHSLIREPGDSGCWLQAGSGAARRIGNLVIQDSVIRVYADRRGGEKVGCFILNAHLPESTRAPGVKGTTS
jgi:hypothetical protein